MQKQVDASTPNLWDNPDYTPGISTAKWTELLNNSTMLTLDDKVVLKRMKDCGAATCVQLAQKYGRHRNFYNRHISALGKRVYDKTNCALLSEEHCRWFQILCYVRKATKDELGSWVWKLRDELSEALTLIDLGNAPLYETFPLEEKQVTASSMMSLSDLKRAAIHYSQLHPIAQKVTRQQFQRSDSVKRYVKARANGYCQLCGKNAPFYDPDGNPYLEVHHIIWLSRGGSDALDNVAALCPNCHRKMHVVQSQTDVEKLKEAALTLSSEYDAKTDS